MRQRQPRRLHPKLLVLVFVHNSNNAGMDDTETVAAVPSAPGHPSANESPASPAALRSPSRVSPPSSARPASRPEAAELPLSDLEFTGCKAVPMTWDQLRRYDERIEVWDARTRTAWMVREPTSPTHENPSHGLAGLAALIAAVRGAPIECFGSMDLMVRDERGEPRRIMQADQTVYLYPQRVELLGAGAMVVGRHNYPDVVLEVDHTTDVRRGKLKLYESWGFPELWVEVPEGCSASRPAGLRPGLTIQMLRSRGVETSERFFADPVFAASSEEAVFDAASACSSEVQFFAVLERRTSAADDPGD